MLPTHRTCQLARTARLYTFTIVEFKLPQFSQKCNSTFVQTESKLRMTWQGFRRFGRRMKRVAAVEKAGSCTALPTRPLRQSTGADRRNRKSISKRSNSLEGRRRWGSVFLGSSLSFSREPYAGPSLKRTPHADERVEEMEQRPRCHPEQA